MSTAVLVQQKPRRKVSSLVHIVSKPVCSAALIVLSDLVSLLLVGICSVLLRQHFNGHFEFSVYYRLWPVFIFFLTVYRFFGIYPGVGVSPVAEIRKTMSATTLVFLVLACLAFITSESSQYSRGVFLLAWSGTLVVIPLMRGVSRRLAAQFEWWGYPVAVWDGEIGRKIALTLKNNPERGLRPVAMLTDDDDGEKRDWGYLPTFGTRESSKLSDLGVQHAIIAASDLSHAELFDTIESQGNIFPHLLVIPDINGLATLGVETREVCRLLALEVRTNLLLRGPQLAKRCMDIALCVISAFAVLPLISALALLIKLESVGPAFFCQTRIGRHGKTFTIWKLRTMSLDSDELLMEYLQQHPELAFEWHVNHKLKNDPRLTRVGLFLRKTSLDELPQLWNVLGGDMSLVGPRPIVNQEVEKYGEYYSFYTKVTPGLTGLWQVSGRNDTTYDERIELDTYYARNWSPWLDIYLLARTFQVLVTREGAY